MKIALAGNPNSGKTTLFNLLTSSTAHVGNYPGVTVEKREGTYNRAAKKLRLWTFRAYIRFRPTLPKKRFRETYCFSTRPTR